MQDYYEYWKIQRPVFSCQTIERDFYVAEGQKGVIKRVMFFCQQGSPLLIVSSPDGHGKTTLARWVYDQLPTETHEVLIVTLLESPNERGWLLARVAQFFGATGADLEAQALASLDELIEEGKKLLVIIDNAQHLDSAIALDEMSSLMQLQSLSQNHFSFLLLSDRPLKEKLSAHAISRQVNFTAELSPLSLDECRAFIQFQLTNQGLPEDLFTDDAIYVLHEISSGLFRMISTIAENCLMEGFIAEETSIKPNSVIKAASYVVGADEKQLRGKYMPKKEQGTAQPSTSEATSQHKKAGSAASRVIGTPPMDIKLTDLLYDDDAS